GRPITDVKEIFIRTRAPSCHALEGQTLTVLRRVRKDGRPHFLLAPLNADPVLIPVDWTDAVDGDALPRSDSGPFRAPNQFGPLGSIADLMRLRAVIDGLSRCPSGTGSQQPSGTEHTNATVPELP